MYIIVNYNLISEDYFSVINEYNNSRLFSEDHLIHFFLKYNGRIFDSHIYFREGTLSKLNESGIMWLTINRHITTYCIVDLMSVNINQHIEDMKDENLKSKLKLVIREESINSILD